MILIIYKIKTLYIVEIILIRFIGKSLELIVLADLFSVSFFFSVTLITLRVIVFRYSYMDHDIFRTRFHMILMSFVLSIVLLIFSPNLLRVLVGWDGLGMSSYLLVIYYSSEKSFKAGIITALTNRIGDALLIVFIRIVFYINTMSSSFIDLENFERRIPIVVLFLIAARTKRAQLPFRAWLPAAIAAPTPVSALVHSSTLVTAGVYLIFRFNILYKRLMSANYLLWAGGLTIFLASLSAIAEMDIKKIVALSTLSQLGVMVLSMGARLIKLGFLHLLAHAFFKALLFLSTGSIIHACDSYQDMRISGGVIEAIPLSSSVILLCLFRLIGIPFIVRFYSKETIIENIVIIDISPIPWIIIVIGVLITRIYSVRIFFLVTSVRTNQGPLHAKSDYDLCTNLRILLLLVPASCGGSILNSIFFKSCTLAASTLESKIILYIILVLGISAIYLIKFIKYNTFKPLQWIIFGMWNLPVITPEAPLKMLRFNGIVLNYLSDYSWTYNFRTSYVTSASQYLIKNRVIFNSNYFRRLIRLRVLRILMFIIM